MENMESMDELYDYEISCGACPSDACEAVVDAYCLDYHNACKYAEHIADGEALVLIMQVLNDYFGVVD